MGTTRIKGTNEDVKTYKASGGDYSDLATWESATSINCVTGTTSPVLECYGHGTGHYDDQVTIAGATTNGTYFRNIRAASGEGHSGIPVTDGSVASFDSTTVTSGDIFNIEETYFNLQDILIMWLSANDSATCDPVNVYTGNYTRIIGVIATAYNSGGGKTYLFRSTNASNVLFFNCLAYESENDGWYTRDAVLVYNCTGVNCSGDAFDDNGGAGTFKNCLGYGSGSNDYETIGTMVTCADSDGTGSFTLSAEPFVDSANDDYHLDVGADGIDDGTDLSGEGYGDDDIDFETRSGTWDCGFDEWVAAGGEERDILGSLAMAGALSRKFLPPRTIEGEI